MCRVQTKETQYITDRVNVLLVCSLRLLLCPYAYEWERGESWIIDRGLEAFPIDTNPGTEERAPIQGRRGQILGSNEEILSGSWIRL